MRWTIPAGALMALAFLIPAAPAVAQTESPGLNEACQSVERKVYKDIRELVTIDLDNATDSQVRVLAAQILAAAKADSLLVVPREIQKRLNGTSDDLRAFFKAGVRNAWSTDLRISVVRTLTGAGPAVKTAAQEVLDGGSIDAYLAYLNNGLYAARALDCASQPTPTPTPSATPSATTTVGPAPTSSASPGALGGEGGGLPMTGAGTATVAGVGGALLLLGGAGYLIGRRRRSRFVA